ncbi:hypothetical protein VHEMI08041 [[Torrubiella] hemipterigena]|uniref:Cytochrome P450 n=1 Tax=[Torrubiella] hemipterigena TaxID=1531966 RepID=A0A0A1T5E3_9HYPO|nr:hypothetical protein VHEMI08041 [[Torrubiella] hemipterigena]
MDATTVAGIASLLLAAAVTADYLHDWKNRRALVDIPLILTNSPLHPWIGRQPKDDYDEEMTRAYQKYTKNGKAFATPSFSRSSTVSIFPPQHSQEWRNVSTDRMSWRIRITEEFLLKDVGLDLNWKVAAQTTLICNRSACIPQVQHHVAHAVDVGLEQLNLSGSSDSTKIKVVETVMGLSSELVVALVFCPGFASDTPFAKDIVNFVTQLEERVYHQRKYPVLLRPLFRRFSSITKTLHCTMAALKKILVPEVLRRIEQRRADKGSGSCSVFYMDVMIHLAFKEGHLDYSCSSADLQTATLIAHHLLLICWGMISPTWMFGTIMLFDLWSRTEYIAPLRQELECAVQKTNGIWTFDMFKHAPRFESFTRESLRMNPPSAMTNGRQALQPLPMESLGQTFYPGARIGFLPARWVHRDPDHYLDPMTFDGYRFVDRETGRCDFRDTITPTETWLPFAIGVSTCPGRLIGTRMIQVMVAKILLGYDAKLEDMDGDLLLHEDGFTIPRSDVEASIKVR